jgi:UDP-N-acetylmuramoyl-tripeptide--D-alanyl-D-alanine ligase
MLELGPSSAEEHAALSRAAAELGVSRLVLVGEGARPAYDAACTADPAADGADGWEKPPLLLPDIDAAYAVLQAELGSGDVVLLKSSRDSGLRVLGDRLREVPLPGPEVGRS